MSYFCICCDTTRDPVLEEFRGTRCYMCNCRLITRDVAAATYPGRCYIPTWATDRSKQGNDADLATFLPLAQ